ncbi:CTP synthase isoform X2 [Leptinotarsa decemlineata]
MGKTVQVVPHITDAIQEWVERVAEKPVSDTGKTPEVCIIELGGTVSDIESVAFLEAFRQFQYRIKRENFCVTHVSPVLQPKTTGDHKTKPTQASIQELRRLGLNPDIIICRSEKPIRNSTKQKISNFCNVASAQVICVPDLESIYEVPVHMEKYGIAKYLIERLELGIFPLLPIEKYMKPWIDLGKIMTQPKYETTVAIVGKYTKLEDAYTSILKALTHAGNEVGCRVNVKFIDSSNLEQHMRLMEPAMYHNAWYNLSISDCVVVPGGFGIRGVSGKIDACKWCRESKTPFLGICLGFQVAVIEFGRNVLGLTEANSTELCKTSNHPVIIEMSEHNNGQMGGTMRLGRRLTVFKDSTEGSKIRRLYGDKRNIYERYRHRFEVNPDYVEEYEKNGMYFVGVDSDQKRMEIFELEDHPYYIGVQYHPEYLSRPMNPSPPFVGLLSAAENRLESYLSQECKVLSAEQLDSDEEYLDTKQTSSTNHCEDSSSAYSSSSLS